MIFNIVSFDKWYLIFAFYPSARMVKNGENITSLKKYYSIFEFYPSAIGQKYYFFWDLDLRNGSIWAQSVR